MFCRFFIDRPIFATVLSLVITLAGGLAVGRLPISLYPPVSPPVVQVDCRYPGANAQVVAEAVAAPIEQQVNGVEGMLYMSSQCTNDGAYNLTVTFRHGMDLKVAQVLVQNRVNLALPLLPEVIKQTGVTTRKRSPDILLSVTLVSPDGRYDQTYLSNYASIRVKDELARLPGVSEIFVTGQRELSMRVWLDPDRLAVRGLTARDVIGAIRQQNAHLALGQLGQQPAEDCQEWQLPLTVVGRLSEPEQFGRIVVKTDGEGRVILLKDVARITLGARNEDTASRLDRRESVGLPVFQLPDANALDVADQIRAKMEELKRDFPEGMQYEIAYDTTPYVRASIHEVFKTLRDAIILVALVVLLFLQNWRSALIPLAAVPVAIIGTFAVMWVAGFSLNNLTLFGLVLAIGIVVDDAIVVVEAVEHHLELGKSPRDAAITAMREVSGPVITVGLVLSAVFIPCAFVGGITGLFFRQFALTIAVSTLISAFNSLTLSPALAALLLRPASHRRGRVLPWLLHGLVAAFATHLFLAPRTWGWLEPRLAEWLPRVHELVGANGRWLVVLAGGLAGVALARVTDRLLRGFFHGFNRVFGCFASSYVWSVGACLRVTPVMLAAYVVLLATTAWTAEQLPRGFVPSQDMGYLMVAAQLPDSASAERGRAVMRKLERIALETPGVAHVNTVAGQSFVLSASGPNYGSQFVLLEDFSKRRSPDLYGEKVAQKMRERIAKEVPEAVVNVFPPPPVRGVGRAGGFRLMIQDRGDLGPRALQEVTDAIVDRAAQQPQVAGLLNVFRANAPQLFVDVDREACLAKEVELKDVFDTLQACLGSLYVNDFNRFGRTWQVIVQAESRFRDQAEDVKRLRVRSTRGEMVPLGALATVKEMNGPLILTRYNTYPAAAINGSAAQGVSSRDAIQLMEQLAQEEIPPRVTYEWTELAFLELQAGNTAYWLFAFAVVMVFLVLAAQYESWGLPLAVILVVPLCLLSAMTGLWLGGFDVNIFVQVGFVVLVGLASKNAILIVEFAKRRLAEGLSPRDAALAACRLRLRPILMTSFAFIFGVLPLLISRGAGFEMRQTLGTTVFAGMIGVTFFGLFLTPTFFVVVEYFAQGWLGRRFGEAQRLAAFARRCVQTGLQELAARAANVTLMRFVATREKK